MQLSEYLKLQNRPIQVTTGGGLQGLNPTAAPTVNSDGESFSDVLSQRMTAGKITSFSQHALRRIESRDIDVESGEKLERLNHGMELLADKGANDALVLVSDTAFLVSVKNNKVITTLSPDDLKGTVFTNIDSAVIV